MADIPAANVTLKEHVSLGSQVLWKAKILGDGAGVTVKVPMKRATGHWVGNIDEADGYNPALSLSGNTLTYATAPTNGKYHWLFVMGFN